MAAVFAAAGFDVVPFGQPAECVVFNTCTVTSKAEQKARREMRLVPVGSPGAVVVITGCYAQLEPDALAAVAPRSVVLPGSRKDRMGAVAAAVAEAFFAGCDPLDAARAAARDASAAPPAPSDPFAYTAAGPASRSRAVLKVEDGCDNACAYCRVSIARGPAASLDPAEVVARARALEAAGLPEIVLTGVNLSQYRAGGLDFPGLLATLVRETASVAYRISSYEPDRVDDAFLAAFALPRIRPHVHLAAQSGSDAVLAAMGRRYGAGDLVRAVESLRAVRIDPFVGLDLILGFPGETDVHFKETMDTLERVDPAWVHAFTFSPRPGTRAWDMKPRVPERVAAERAAAVGDLARRGKARFAARRLGTELEAVAERSGGGGAGESARGGFLTAVSADYLKLAVRGAPAGLSGAFRCRVIALGAVGNDASDLVAQYIGHL